MVKQISVFLENKEGRLAKVTRILRDESINIRALSIADTTDFGILRLIVNDPDSAFKALQNAGFTVSVKEVLAIGISDECGSLASALTALEGSKIVVEYMYAFVCRSEGQAQVILKVSDNEKAAQVLQAAGVSVIDGEQLYLM